MVMTTDLRLSRIERVVAALAQERFGTPGVGPMDPVFRHSREMVKRDLAAIVREQAEAVLETRA